MTYKIFVKEHGNVVMQSDTPTKITKYIKKFFEAHPGVYSRDKMGDGGQDVVTTESVSDGKVEEHPDDGLLLEGGRAEVGTSGVPTGGGDDDHLDTSIET